METTKKTGMREIRTTQTDYEAYIECFMRTDYSDEVGKRSKADKDPFSFGFDKYCRRINKQKETATHTIVYENKEGNVVAVAELRKEGKALRIKEFVVNRIFQLSGYGSKFYREIEALAKEKGYREINLNCYFPGAITFWLKMGFADRGIFIKKL